MASRDMKVVAVHARCFGTKAPQHDALLSKGGWASWARPDGAEPRPHTGVAK